MKKREIILKKLRRLKRNLEKLEMLLLNKKYVIPQHMSLKEWDKYKKEHNIKGPKDYEKQHPGTKWKVVHGDEKGMIGKPIKGMENMSYNEAIKAHAAIMVSKQKNK